MKQRKKENVDSKICIVCSRPFSWRKKWEKVWEDVKYCSDKCTYFKVDLMKFLLFVPCVCEKIGDKFSGL